MGAAIPVCGSAPRAADERPAFRRGGGRPIQARPQRGLGCKMEDRSCSEVVSVVWFVSGISGGRCKATWKREFKLPWRKAGPPNHHDDKVDSDQ